MTDRSEAERLVDLGNELSEAGRPSDAERAYRAATEADPAWSVPWYDLGLLYKYQGNWAESLTCNKRAGALDPTDQASWWNLGIAATALADWQEARRAWRECGIQLAPGEGPPEGDFGPTPVRLDPNGDGEVVWARRIDPARARLISVPLPTSTFRWHDLVLHDGAAVGYRVLHDRQLPVFNVLSCLERSPVGTFIVELGTSDPDAVEALARVADELGGAAENWGSSTNILCRQCSLGVPHQHNERSNSPAHPHCGVAARDAMHLNQILELWIARTPLADMVRWTPAPGSAA